MSDKKKDNENAFCEGANISEPGFVVVARQEITQVAIGHES